MQPIRDIKVIALDSREYPDEAAIRKQIMEIRRSDGIYKAPQLSGHLEKKPIDGPTLILLHARHPNSRSGKDAVYAYGLALAGNTDDSGPTITFDPKTILDIHPLCIDGLQAALKSVSEDEWRKIFSSGMFSYNVISLPMKTLNEVQSLMKKMELQ